MPGSEDHEQDYTLVSGVSPTRQARGLLAGDIIGGNYKIKSVITRGGMGVIYRAEHMAIHRDVALKALAPEHVDEIAWQRFEAEGKAIAKLDHHNIVKVYDMGTDGSDFLYYVMDMLHGVTLAQYLKSKKLLDVPEMLEIFDQVCAGLGYAHARGIVHRDLKPSNIFLCKSPYKVPLVKIIDYGLVKLVDEANRNTQSLTAMGIICGSPPYMSPEQCAGGKIDPRSDVYSLGCTIFECLTGEPPLKGKSPLETMSLHINSPVPKLRDFRPDRNYSSGLEELVARMLEKFPAQRQQNMAMVAQDLARIKEGKSISRASTFGPKPLYSMDKNTARLSEPDNYTAGVPLGLVLTASALGFLIVVGAGFYFFLTQNLRHSGPEGLSEASMHSRDVFARCPQISNGITLQSGQPVRVFNFPDVSIGRICWGPDINKPDTSFPAMGKVVAPANFPVTLVTEASPDCDILKFPGILSKIGPEDIAALRVVLPGGKTQGDVQPTRVGPEYLQAISQWRGLRILELYDCVLPQKTILALNSIAPVSNVSFCYSELDAADIVKVKWFPDIRDLDLRYTNDVDPVLFGLHGNPNLSELKMDMCKASLKGLAELATCPNLRTLSIQQCEFEDEKLSTVCNISTLHTLKIQTSMASPDAYLTNLPRLKNLRYAELGLCPLTRAQIDRLGRQMPGCEFHCVLESIINGKDDSQGTSDPLPRNVKIDASVHGIGN